MKTGDYVLMGVVLFEVVWWLYQFVMYNLDFRKYERTKDPYSHLKGGYDPYSDLKAPYKVNR